MEPTIETTTKSFIHIQDLNKNEIEAITNFQHFRESSGKAQLHEPCTFSLYARFWRQFQILSLRNNSYSHNSDSATVTQMELNLAIEWEEFVSSGSVDQETLGNKMCKTSGLHYRLPMQCGEDSGKCECLVVPELGINSVQPIGTNGCLGYENSFCDNAKIECGFGFACVHNVCVDQWSRSDRSAQVSVSVLGLCAAFQLLYS